MICTGSDMRWLDVVKSFKDTAFRLEQEKAYLDDVHSGALDEWLAGATEPPPPNDWSRFVAAKVQGGAVIERVRVIDTPMTPYQQWLVWASAKNVEAGEVQTYLPRAESLGGHGDFWLLDSSTLVAFTFDDRGSRTVEVSEDIERIRTAMAEWNEAIERSGRLSELVAAVA